MKSQHGVLSRLKFERFTVGRYTKNGQPLVNPVQFDEQPVVPPGAPEHGQHARDRSACTLQQGQERETALG